MNPGGSEVTNPRLNAIFIGLALFWSAVIAAFSALDYRESYVAALALARSTAAESYSKDMVYRRWSTMHGGVYVPVTPATPPNPDLSDIPERDITTPSGRKLTLVNPAYMTRQVHELGRNDSGSRGHITSLNPIRPGSAPDAWERRALEAFERGGKEALALEPLQGVTYLRFMRPLITEAGCLKCHAKQGYKLGDIRGGISVSIPWAPYREKLQSQQRLHQLGDGAIWALGMLGLGLGRQRLKKHLTGRKRAEKALKGSEEKFRKAFYLSPDSININRLEDGLYVSVNRGFTQILGYTEEEIIGHSSTEYNIWDDPRDRARLIAGLKGGGTVANLDARLRAKDGSIRHGLMSAAVVQIEGVAHIISITRDITERKKAGEERARLEAQLRESQKMEALGTLAGGVAHDFNNALATIMGNVELARQDVGPAHPALESLEEIAKAGGRAKALVRQILVFGRRQVLERKVISLAPVVREAASLLRATLPAGIGLDVECAPDAPAVLADARQIEQVLLNLCSNAWHALQGKEHPGAIQIRLDAEVRAGLRFAVLTVQDQGRGMEEATRARVFEPFFTTKAVDEGTGLGLAVVHSIVKEHGASIEVHSTAGTGTSVVIHFPEAQAPAAPVPPADAADAGENGVAQAAGKHILYVDDDESIVLLMTRLLRRKGYRVSGYTDAREALAAARANPDGFDLAVTDYNMPDMSGLDLARALKALRPDLPLALASGYITQELRQEAPAAGVSELIYKPDTADALCEAVARLASGRGTDDKS